ncbi:MAG: hypothetical protein Q9188_007607, partial [Gyalolechia gomerana]
AGPRPQSTAQKTSKPSRPPHQRIGHLNPSAQKDRSSSVSNRKRSRPSKRNAKGSDTGGDSESILSELDADGMDVDVDVEGGEEGEEGDDQKYCTCQKKKMKPKKQPAPRIMQSIPPDIWKLF